MALVSKGNTRRALGDYLGLAKPRTVLLHLCTAAAAMFLAAKGLPPWATLGFTLVGGGLVAGASNALNCYFDRDLDGRMARTRRRPLPSGRLKPAQALAFGIVTGLSGLLLLGLLIGWLAAALSAGALAYYVVIYTLWSKRRTFWSTLIGTGAGAVPPLVGWVAVTGRVEPTPFLLFAIISLWTPPHFWALALFRQSDYAKAGLPVLPPRHAVRWLLACLLLMVMASLLLVPIAGMGPMYLVAALALGTGFAAMVMFPVGRTTSIAARRLYLYSIAYLLLLFAAMAADRLVFYT